MGFSRDGVQLGALTYNGTFAPQPLRIRIGSPRHGAVGEIVTFESSTQVLKDTRAGEPEAKSRRLDTQLDALLDEHRNPPVWNFSLLELDVLTRFYRRCADRGFAVYADDGA